MTFPIGVHLGLGHRADPPKERSGPVPPVFDPRRSAQGRAAQPDEPSRPADPPGRTSPREAEEDGLGLNLDMRQGLDIDMNARLGPLADLGLRLRLGGRDRPAPADGPRPGARTEERSPNHAGAPGAARRGQATPARIGARETRPDPQAAIGRLDPQAHYATVRDDRAPAQPPAHRAGRVPNEDTLAGGREASATPRPAPEGTRRPVSEAARGDRAPAVGDRPRAGAADRNTAEDRAAEPNPAGQARPRGEAGDRFAAGPGGLRGGFGGGFGGGLDRAPPAGARLDDSGERAMPEAPQRHPADASASASDVAKADVTKPNPASGTRAQVRESGPPDLRGPIEATGAAHPRDGEAPPQHAAQARVAEAGPVRAAPDAGATPPAAARPDAGERAAAEPVARTAAESPPHAAASRTAGPTPEPAPPALGQAVRTAPATEPSPAQADVSRPTPAMEALPTRAAATPDSRYRSPHESTGLAAPAPSGTGQATAAAVPAAPPVSVAHERVEGAAPSEASTGVGPASAVQAGVTPIPQAGITAPPLAMAAPARANPTSSISCGTGAIEGSKAGGAPPVGPGDAVSASVGSAYAAPGTAFSPTGGSGIGGVPLALFNPLLGRRRREARPPERADGLWAILRMLGWGRRERAVPERLEDEEAATLRAWRAALRRSAGN